MAVGIAAEREKRRRSLEDGPGRSVNVVGVEVGIDPRHAHRAHADYCSPCN